MTTSWSTLAPRYRDLGARRYEAGPRGCCSHHPQAPAAPQHPPGGEEEGGSPARGDGGAAPGTRGCGRDLSTVTVLPPPPPAHLLLPATTTTTTTTTSTTSTTSRVSGSCTRCPVRPCQQPAPSPVAGSGGWSGCSRRHPAAAAGTGRSRWRRGEQGQQQQQQEGAVTSRPEPLTSATGLRTSQVTFQCAFAKFLMSLLQHFFAVFFYSSSVILYLCSVKLG